MWVYERKMFFGAAWILVPIPIVAWPAGYYETRVHFRDDQVVYVSREYGDFETYPEIRLH